ncbi:MAG: sigma 54-interacting transcriptional regulator [Deltaproteobacteria bacterium]|nr:sigma 54-interacting transcriptional regulator [Deltaproteobacteria bacterium]
MTVEMLRVIAPGSTTTEGIVLDGNPVTIGREGHVTGPLARADSEISRQHAIIARGPNGIWSVTDQSSRNGTFVDGARVETAALRDGSVIRAGRTLLVFAQTRMRADERLAAPADARLVGDSLAALRVHGEIALVARQPLPVLVLGETGVGKELVAEEIHRRSRRAGPFIAVNCAAIAPELAESELFGHVAGAFTGARAAADGLFVAAEGGTLFLDEVGELPAELQPKLLRALAQGEVRAVGSTTARRVDVRVVAATLRDLDAEVAAGRFRGDLFNRLAGWRIEIPSLRARRDDIVAIASAFLRAANGPALGPDAAEALLLHDWPGNVRELERVIAAAVVRATDARAAELGLAHLPPPLVERLGTRVTASTAPPLLVPSTSPPTRDELCHVLTRMDGNIARVAEHFGKERQQIYRWAKRLDIDLDAYRRES